MSKAHDSECECQEPGGDCCCSYRAEIERLRTDYALLSDDYKQVLGDVERLRGLLAECDGYLDYAELNLKQRVRKVLGNE